MGMMEKRLASAMKKAGREAWTKAEWRVALRLSKSLVKKQAIFERRTTK